MVERDLETPYRGSCERAPGASAHGGRSRNYQLAASELSQVVENYSGTYAADEAQVLLAEVRLSQGQTQQAIDLLKRFAPSAGTHFQAQAYGLLGAGHENAGQVQRSR